MPFTHDVTVRFKDVDRAGIGYFACVFDWCHFAFEEAIDVALDGFAGAFGRDGWMMPLVHAEADFERPFRLGDRLTVRVGVERIGGRSLTFVFGITTANDPDTLHATVRHVHAFVDIETMEAHPVPQALLDGLVRAGISLPA